MCIQKLNEPHMIHPMSDINDSGLRQIFPTVLESSVNASPGLSSLIRAHHPPAAPETLDCVAAC